MPPKFERNIEAFVGITPSQGKPKGWRAAARMMAGGDAVPQLFKVLMDIAEGKAVLCTLPDGRIGPPIVPTAADRLRAATEYIHAVIGRPVPQTEIVQAEAAGQELEALQALSDDELLNRARSALERGLHQMNQRLPPTMSTDAELVARETGPITPGVENAGKASEDDCGESEP
jgi:hypothetical protein